MRRVQSRRELSARIELLEQKLSKACTCIGTLTMHVALLEYTRSSAGWSGYSFAIPFKPGVTGTKITVAPKDCIVPSIDRLYEQRLQLDSIFPVVP